MSSPGAPRPPEGGAGAGEERERVLVVVGTRPEVIKMAPVVHALREEPGLDTRVALTGQHTDLVDQVIRAFHLQPDWDLGIMQEGQSLYDVAHGCLDGLREVVTEARPDLVLVQGDTASVFLGSLVAFFERVRVGHVEAGLRSGNRWAPWPEEIFRRLTDTVCELHFAPTPGARDHLLAEGVDPGTVFVTGNTVVDALLEAARSGAEPAAPELVEALRKGGRMVLLTAHRRESFGEPIRRVFGAVRDLVDEHPDVRVVYPVHPNPRVRGPAEALLSGHPRIHLIEPLDYLDLVAALRAATLVLTDSGGIQEEAPTFGAPVLVLREVTERPEGIEAGVARLVGTDPERIRGAAREVLSGSPTAASGRRNPYGDGQAGARIADVVAAELLGRPRRLGDWGGA